MTEHTIIVVIAVLIIAGGAAHYFVIRRRHQNDYRERLEPILREVQEEAPLPDAMTATVETWH